MPYLRRLDTQQSGLIKEIRSQERSYRSINYLLDLCRKMIAKVIKLKLYFYCESSVIEWIVYQCFLCMLIASIFLVDIQRKLKMLRRWKNMTCQINLSANSLNAGSYYVRLVKAPFPFCIPRKVTIVWGGGLKHRCDFILTSVFQLEWCSILASHMFGHVSYW